MSVSTAKNGSTASAQGPLPVELVCRRSLPEGTQVGRFWRAPCRGGAIFVLLDGDALGRWVNTGTGATGDVRDLIALMPPNAGVEPTVEVPPDSVQHVSGRRAQVSTCRMKDRTDGSRNLVWQDRLAACRWVGPGSASALLLFALALLLHAILAVIGLPG